jgi:hypothetical protein
MSEEKKQPVEGEEIQAVSVPGDIVKAEDMLEQLDRRDTILKRALALSIGQTNKSDWKDIGGKPYLEASGAHKVARLWGIGIADVKYVKTNDSDEQGAYYRYEYTATFSMKGEPPQEVIGTCSSRDKFFGTLSEKRDQSGKILQEAGFKKHSEIDENNIQKKAYTNCINNGIKQYTGMKNVSWEDVALHAKGKDKIGRVEFQAGKQATGNGKKSDDDKFNDIEGWLELRAYHKIINNDGELGFENITDKKELLKRSTEILSKETAFGQFMGFKTVGDMRKKIDPSTDNGRKRIYAIWKNQNEAFLKWKEEAIQAGVEGL